MQYLEYWSNSIPGILIQSNTSNIGSIQSLNSWAERGQEEREQVSTRGHWKHGGRRKLVFKVLADVLDKTEILFENFESQVAEAHAEVPDQSCRFCRCKLAIFFYVTNSFV